MKKLLITTAVLAALGAPAAANAANQITFDRDGAGGSAAVHVDQWAWQTGEVLCNDCTTTSGGSLTGTLLIQAALSGMTLGGNSVGPALNGISYQLSIPVSTVVTSGGGGMSVTQSSAGTMTLYADPTPGYVYATGCGFGPLQVGCAANGDQIPILTGVVNIDSLGLNFSIIDGTLLFGTGVFPIVPLAPNTGGTVNTDNMGGSVTLNINATSGTEDTNYFVSDITSFNLDLRIVSASLRAPMTIDASSQIMGVTPSFNDSTPQLNTTQCTRDAIVNPAACDQQYQVSANTDFNHTVPEPGSLAMLGLGLGLAGFIGRRRRASR